MENAPHLRGADQHGEALVKISINKFTLTLHLTHDPIIKKVANFVK